MARTKKNLRGGVAGDKRKRDEDSAPPPSKKTKLECGCDNDIMKYHLRADMIHDHKSSSFEGENEAMSALYCGNDNRTTAEDEVVKYIKATYRTDSGDENYRVQNSINFTQDNKTDMFPQHAGSPFRPFEGVDNSKVAVLQDAGFVLYRAIGSQNLITFGSILDQAGKPASKEDNPYCFPSAASLTIDPCVYGFNKNVVGDITISNFTGKSVKCIFPYKYGDAWEPNGGTGDALQINKRKGDFMSIEEVRQERFLNKKFAGYIGKALGDITLVASLTKKIGNTPNLFYPSSDLTALYGREQITDIQNFLLNTGDRLNHIRAFMFGVGSVYSPPGVNGIRTFEYIPGIAEIQEPIAVRTMYLNRIKLLIIQIDTAYGDLIAHLKNEVVPGAFDISKSMKSGLELIKPGTEGRAKKAIDYLINVIEAYRTYVLFYYLVFYKYHESLDESEIPDLKNTYEILLNNSTGLMPSSTSTLGNNGRDIRVFVNILKTTYLLFSNYSIANTDTEIDFKKQVDIAFGREEASEKIIPKKEVDRLISSLYTESRTQTVIPDDHFPITSLWSNGLEKTHTFYVSDVYQLIGKNKTILEPFSYIFWTFKFGDNPDKAPFVEMVSGSMTGGNNEFEAFAQVYRRPTKRNQLPDNLVIPQSEYCSDILTDFLKSGKTVETIIGALQTYSEYEYSIIDPLLLKQLVIDYKNAIGDEKIIMPERWNTSTEVSTKESLEFNAFACAYNGISASAFSPFVFKRLSTLRPVTGGGRPSVNELSNILEKYANEFEVLANMPVKGQLDEAKSSVSSRSNSQARSVNGSQETTSINGSLWGSSGTASPYSQFSRESSIERLSPPSSPIYTKIRDPRRQSFGMAHGSPGQMYEGGQRVPTENLYIDWTKSFVRRGGSSPKSMVK